MVELLARKIIKNSEDVKDAGVRQQYGTLCGAVGIFLNILLCIGKFIAGSLTGSVAITADAINNLSDAGSSLIMMLGFKMAGRKPNPEHPFGHGRIEYITGLIVSGLIILMSVELIKSSVDKIINPTTVDYSYTALIILIFSILIKLYMFGYNRRIGKKISSSAMNATAMDSLTDSAATAVVLLSAFIGQATGLAIDGYCGMLVALFVFYAGFSSAKDTLEPLLGCPPEEEFVNQIEKFVVSNEGIIGIHDLVVHDYGPGRSMISLHAEVPANGDIIEIHDTIDNIEQRLYEVLGIHATIHMDPIVVDDLKTDRMKRLSHLIAKSIDEKLTIHDFRMVQGPTHTNLIFDVVVPYDVKMTEEEVKSAIEQKIRDLPGEHFAVIKIDRPYV